MMSNTISYDQRAEGSQAIYTGDEPGSPTVLRMPSASLIFRVIVLSIKMTFAEYNTGDEGG